MKNNKIKVIIFDCDGVMFDSRKANINYYNHILDHFNLPPMTEDKVKFVHMNTANESISHILKGTDLLEEALEYKKKVDYTPFLDDMIIEPCLKSLLMSLKPDFGLSVATNRSDTIGKVIEKNGLGDFFDIVISSLDVEKPKPHPESILKILNFFQIEPLEAVYIGDSEIDQKTALAAGVIFIAYKNKELESDFHADAMSGVERIIRNLCDEG